MLFGNHEPLGDPPPGYWRHVAANWRRNLLLALLDVLGAGFTWWTESHRLA